MRASKRISSIRYSPLLSIYAIIRKSFFFVIKIIKKILTHKKKSSESGSINDYNNKIKKTSTGNDDTIEIPGTYSSSLNEINILNKKINNITQMVEKLAFQTNTLALNAAVEAVKAGDKGCGFTAIASELRNLANNTSSALRQINYIFNDTNRKLSENTNRINHPEKNPDDIQTQMANLINTFNEMYASFTRREKNSDRMFMGANNIAQKNFLRTDRKGSVRKSEPLHEDNSTGFDPFIKVKKPTIH